MSSYVLYDCPPDEDFLAGLEEATGRTWVARYADGRASVNKIVRLARYFLFPLLFLVTTRHVKEIVAWQQFYGILAAVYLRIIRRKVPVCILTFIYKPKSGLAGTLMYRLVNYALTSSNVDNVVVYSPSEVATYARLFPQAADKFVYLPLGISPRPESDPSVTDLCEPRPSDAYIFAAGRSNRDYTPLKEAAERVGLDLRIACPEENSEGYSHTTVLKDCFGSHMERELRDAAIVAVPLAASEISSGQLALLQAMRAGRPVIATDHPSLRDYVLPDTTAILVRNVDEWEQAIRNLLADKDLADRIAIAGHRHMLANFSLHRLGCRLGLLLRK